MKPQERYRFFPIGELEAALSAGGQKASVTVNGKPSTDMRIVLEDGMNDIRLKYPRKASCELSVELRIRKGQSSVALIRHLPSGGTGRFRLNVVMEDGASLKLTEETRTGSYLQSLCSYDIAGECSLDVSTIDIDNVLMTRDQVFNLRGRNSEVSVRGIFLSASGENTDNYIKMNHLCPDCVSTQDYRGVSSGKASFLGHIYIAQDSQRSTALQQSRNILVGETGDIHARPWLEIYADDVKCNHGATVGVSDEQALFYMRQRGIPEEEARALLLEGFLNPVAEAADSGIKKYIKAKLASL